MAGCKQLGLGTDIGPLAICYRTDLFKAAGLPTDPAEVSALWANGWDGYIAAGQQYKANAPLGKSGPTPRAACSTPSSASRRTSTTTPPAS